MNSVPLQQTSSKIVQLFVMRTGSLLQQETEQLCLKASTQKMTFLQEVLRTED